MALHERTTGQSLRSGSKSAHSLLQLLLSGLSSNLSVCRVLEAFVCLASPSPTVDEEELRYDRLSLQLGRCESYGLLT